MTSTSAPSRRHTEPSSSPITPAPTTRSRCGTLSNTSAPVEETMRFSSIATPLSRATSEPVAITVALVSIVLVRAVGRRDLDLAGGEHAADPDMGIDLVLLEQERHALDVAVDAFVLEFLHGGEIEHRLADADAHPGEGVAGLLEQLRGMEQGFRGNAPDIEAGAAEGLVLLDHRHLHAELRRANGADIAAGAATDDGEIVGGHFGLSGFVSSRSACGGSRKIVRGRGSGCLQSLNRSQNGIQLAGLRVDSIG